MIFPTSTIKNIQMNKTKKDRDEYLSILITKDVVTIIKQYLAEYIDLPLLQKWITLFSPERNQWEYRSFVRNFFRENPDFFSDSGISFKDINDKIDIHSFQRENEWTLRKAKFSKSEVISSVSRDFTSTFKNRLKNLNNRIIISDKVTSITFYDDSNHCSPVSFYWEIMKPKHRTLGSLFLELNWRKCKYPLEIISFNKGILRIQLTSKY